MLGSMGDTNERSASSEPPSSGDNKDPSGPVKTGKRQLSDDSSNDEGVARRRLEERKRSDNVSKTTRDALEAPDEQQEDKVEPNEPPNAQDRAPTDSDNERKQPTDGENTGARTDGNPSLNSAGLRDSHLTSMRSAGLLQDPSQANLYSHHQLLMAGHGLPGQLPLGFPFNPSPPGNPAFSAASLPPPDQNRRPPTSAMPRGADAQTANNDQGQGNSVDNITLSNAAMAMNMARSQGLRNELPYGGGLQAAALQQFFAQQQSGGLDLDATRMMMAGLPMGLPGGGLPGGFLLGGPSLRPPVVRPHLPFRLPMSPAVSLGLPCDDDNLSEYQILVRKQLDVFEAQPEDVESNTQGRKRQVVLGQVGLRCRHCAGVPLRQRGRGAVYYPAKLQGIYQAAQNMASSHLCESCQSIDPGLKAKLKALRERRDTASGGKQYWADGARVLGLVETEDGLRLSKEPR